MRIASDKGGYWGNRGKELELGYQPEGDLYRILVPTAPERFEQCLVSNSMFRIISGR